jgi:hypothetical protein
MKTYLRTLLAIAVISTAIAGSASAQQSNRQIQLDYLLTKHERFGNYLEDFNALSYPEKYGADGDRATSLYDKAAMAGELANAMHGLLLIDSQLSCETDHTKAWQVIKGGAEYYAKQVGIIIGMVNTRLEHIRLPALAATATQMKDDLRDLKGFFESLRPN